MPTVQVKFTAKTGIDVFTAAIDDKRLKFDGDGNASRNVTAGDDHALTWFVRGTPGSKYSIQITAPPEAVFKHDGTIDNSGVDAGVQWFHVN